jgi:hypothetical protein
MTPEEKVYIKQAWEEIDNYKIGKNNCKHLIDDDLDPHMVKYVECLEQRKKRAWDYIQRSCSDGPLPSPNL